MVMISKRTMKITMRKMIGTGYLRVHPHRPVWEVSGGGLEETSVLRLGTSEVSSGLCWVGERG